MPISNEKFKKFKKFLEFQEFQEIPRICEFGKISKNFKSFNTELQGSRFCQVYIQQEVSYFSTFEKNFDHEKSQARIFKSSSYIYIYTVVLIRNTQYSKYSKYSRSFQRSIFKGLRIGFKVESWSRRQTPVFITPQRGSAGSNHSKIYYLEYLLLFTGLFEFMEKKITLLRVTV